MITVDHLEALRRLRYNAKLYLALQERFHEMHPAVRDARENFLDAIAAAEEKPGVVEED